MADGLGHILGGMGALGLHQNRVNIGTAGLGCDHRIENARGPWAIEGLVFRGTPALLPDGIVVLGDCASCASFKGMNTMGSPLEETIRRVKPTTVYLNAGILVREVSEQRPLGQSHALGNGRRGQSRSGFVRPPTRRRPLWSLLDAPLPANV